MCKAISDLIKFYSDIWLFFTFNHCAITFEDDKMFNFLFKGVFFIPNNIQSFDSDKNAYKKYMLSRYRSVTICLKPNAYSFGVRV